MLNAAISPDGKYLSYADQQGLHLHLVATGSSQNRAIASRRLANERSMDSWWLVP